MIKKRFFFILFIFFLIFCVTEVSLHFIGVLYLKRLYVHRRPDKRSSLDSINIVCLGESSTAGLWVDQQDSYPAQLETMLRKQYPQKGIRVFVPPHVGQNTSQVSNRMEQHITFYAPSLIILMVGYNNEWSLAESQIGKFLSFNDPEVAKIKASILLSNLRVFKILRYVYLKYIVKDESDYMRSLEALNYIWGGPELVRSPPKRFIYSFAVSHKEAFIKLWKYDVQRIISVAKKHNINIILMTYHINPTYLSLEEFILMVRRENIPLVRNDKTFQILIKNGTINEYLVPNKDNWHLNKKGYTLIAQSALEAIVNNNLLEVTNNF